MTRLVKIRRKTKELSSDKISVALIEEIVALKIAPMEETLKEMRQAMWITRIMFQDLRSITRILYNDTSVQSTKTSVLLLMQHLEIVMQNTAYLELLKTPEDPSPEEETGDGALSMDTRHNSFDTPEEARAYIEQELVRIHASIINAATGQDTREVRPTRWSSDSLDTTQAYFQNQEDLIENVSSDDPDNLPF